MTDTRPEQCEMGGSCFIQQQLRAKVIHNIS